MGEQGFVLKFKIHPRCLLLLLLDLKFRTRCIHGYDTTPLSFLIREAPCKPAVTCWVYSQHWHSQACPKGPISPLLPTHYFICHHYRGWQQTQPSLCFCTYQIYASSPSKPRLPHLISLPPSHPHSQDKDLLSLRDYTVWHTMGGKQTWK